MWIAAAAALVLAVLALAATWWGRRRVERRARVLELCALAVARGAPLAGVLRRTAERQSPRTTTNAVLAALADRLDEGQSLSQALAASGHLFPERVVAAVAAAESSGGGGTALAGTLRQEARDNEQLDGVWQQLLLGLCYPAVLAFAFVALDRQGLLRRLDLVLAVAEPSDARGGLEFFAFTARAVALVFVAALCAAAIARTGWFGCGRPAVQAVLQRFVPLLPLALRELAMERALRALSLQLRRGLPLGDALRAAAAACGHVRTHAAFVAAAVRAEAGAPVEVVWSLAGIPAGTAARGALGGAPERLADALEDGARSCRERMERAMARFRLWLHPLVVLVFGGLLFVLMFEMETMLDAIRARVVQGGVR